MAKEITKDSIDPSQNKMGTMPVGKVLFQMALPMIFSMLVISLYNVVDSIFVSKINESAITAVSLVFPIQNLMTAISSGTAVGVNALLSRSLGEKNVKNANSVAKNGIFLGIMSAIIFAAIMVIIARPFMMTQTDNPLTLEYGVQYMSICAGVCVGIFMQVTFERLLISTGRTLLSMTSQIIGAVFNLIFDPLLIFGIGPFPKMGVAGAAVATVAGQCVAAVVALFLNVRKNKELDISMKGFRPSGKMIGNIYKIGVPSIIMISISTVMVMCMNMILIRSSGGETAVAVFGIYFKINSMICMPIFGLNTGMVPLIAFNYGARHRKRITRTVFLSVIAATLLMMVGLALFQIIPDKLLLLFDASENMLGIGVPALRIISISFIFAGYCIVIGSALQALGNAVSSMLISLARQLFVLVPVSFVFAMLWDLPAVWWSYPIAEVASVTASTFFFMKVYKTKIKPLPE